MRPVKLFNPARWARPGGARPPGQVLEPTGAHKSKGLPTSGLDSVDKDSGG